MIQTGPAFSPTRQNPEAIFAYRHHSAICGIPLRIVDQLKAGHRITEAMQQQVCAIAQQDPSPSLGPNEVLGQRSAGEPPPVRSATSGPHPLLRAINPL